VPAPGGRDDSVRIGGPVEGPRVVVGLGEEPVDGPLEVDDGVEDAARRRLVCLAKNRSAYLHIYRADMGTTYQPIHIQRIAIESGSTTSGLHRAGCHAAIVHGPYRSFTRRSHR